MKANELKFEPRTVQEWIDGFKNNEKVNQLTRDHGPETFDVLYDALNHPYVHCYDAILGFGTLCYESGRMDVILQSQRIARELMDCILYSNDYINRWSPFDIKKHYGDWWPKIAAALVYPVALYGAELFSEEKVSLLGDGDFDEMTEFINEYHLEKLNELLNEYFDWLETIEAQEI